jgi:hypothetical protein
MLHYSIGRVELTDPRRNVAAAEGHQVFPCYFRLSETRACQSYIFPLLPLVFGLQKGKNLEAAGHARAGGVITARTFYLNILRTVSTVGRDSVL